MESATWPLERIRTACESIEPVNKTNRLVSTKENLYHIVHNTIMKRLKARFYSSPVVHTENTYSDEDYKKKIIHSIGIKFAVSALSE